MIRSRTLFQKHGSHFRSVLLMLSVIFKVFASLADDPAGGDIPQIEPQNPNSKVPAFMGDWIWDSKTIDGQMCQLWRAFDVPADNKIVHARLLVTADNEFTLFFDGQEIGHGAEWRELFDYNLALLLSPGRHVLAVMALNPTGFAGMLFGLRIEFADGQILEIKSDANWKIVPDESRSWREMVQPSATWRPATVLGPIGTPPWWREPVRVNAMLTPSPAKIYFWQTVWFQVVFFSILGVLAVTIFSLAAQLALHRKERWLLTRERARIAMDVHDDIGSRMTHLVLNGEVAKDEVPAESNARARLEQVCEEARGVLSSIDEILWALNPRRDTLQDFADYVCDYTQRFLAPTSIECVFDLDVMALDAAADLPLRRSLLMAIKEALNNVVKYSQATELLLQIKQHRHNLLVVVQDNGKGFDMSAIKPGRHGVSNISKRIRELGGTCNISSEPGKGCRIEFCIPLRNPRKFSLPGFRRD
jgi:signal transduction histidine kinase